MILLIYKKQKAFWYFFDVVFDLDLLFPVWLFIGGPFSLCWHLLEDFLHVEE